MWIHFCRTSLKLSRHVLRSYGKDYLKRHDGLTGHQLLLNMFMEVEEPNCINFYDLRNLNNFVQLKITLVAETEYSNEYHLFNSLSQKTIQIMTSRIYYKFQLLCENFHNVWIFLIYLHVCLKPWLRKPLISEIFSIPTKFVPKYLCTNYGEK